MIHAPTSPRTRPLLAALALGCLGAAAGGQAVVNAPVAPDAIYVAGDAPGHYALKVIDLNGFGAGTGDPAYDPANPTAPGSSNFPNNPNVAFQGALLVPPLQPGTTTLDGGSAGVFTLTKNSLLSDALFDAPQLGAASDMMLGHPLDLVYNAGPPPFGCQSGGGSVCTSTALKLVNPAAAGPSTVAPSSGTPGGLLGAGNPISWSPHPNPPPLLANPLCTSPEILGQEPTSVASLQLGLANLLVPGDPFGDPGLGLPPTGLLAAEQNAFFVGPGLPQASIPACELYQVRQQVGHFLYVADRRRDEVVVLNSNRMTVLERIPVKGPYELAMSPNLDLLAVSSRGLGAVVFIDTNPASSAFHTVVKSTAVGARPAGIAWQPDNEDVLVCNEGSGSVSILSAATLEVRKTVVGGLQRPFGVVATPRQTSFGSQSNVYYAWILDRAGRLTLFESGPDGVNGWGYDALLGQVDATFEGATAIQPDPRQLESGVCVAHGRLLDSQGQPVGVPGGAVTNVVLQNPVTGVVPIDPAVPPSLHGLSFAIPTSVGGDQLTGRPFDLAFDNLLNVGALPASNTIFSAGSPAPINGKQMVRSIGGVAQATSSPRYLFVPVQRGAAGAGAVDVLDLATGARVDVDAHQPGTQSIDSPGAALVMDYFRQ